MSLRTITNAEPEACLHRFGACRDECSCAGTVWVCISTSCRSCEWGAHTGAQESRMEGATGQEEGDIHMTRGVGMRREGLRGGTSAPCLSRQYSGTCFGCYACSKVHLSCLPPKSLCVQCQARLSMHCLLRVRAEPVAGCGCCTFCAAPAQGTMASPRPPCGLSHELASNTRKQKHPAPRTICPLCHILDCDFWLDAVGVFSLHSDTACTVG